MSPMPATTSEPEGQPPAPTSVASVAAAAWNGLSYVARTMGVPRGLRGLAVEIAYTAVHLTVYPWGLLDEALRPGGVHVHHRTDSLPPGERSLLVSDLDGIVHPGAARARHRRQPLDLPLPRPGPAPPRPRHRAGGQLQPDDGVHRRHPGRGTRPGRARRAAVRGGRRRPGPRHRPLARRADRAVLRAAARRGRPRRHAGHPRHPAPGVADRPPAAADRRAPPAPARLRPAPGARPSPPRTAAPGSSRCGAAWTS